MTPDNQTLILTAAAAASIGSTHGPRHRVTVKDIKREMAALTGTRLHEIWHFTECGRYATGAKISAVVRQSQQYAPIRKGRRIIGFIPVTASAGAEGEQAA